MIPNPYVFSTQIKETPCLMPFGQGVADRLQSLVINESGLLLWEALSRGEDRDALLKRLCALCEAAPGEESILARDLDDFLCTLKAGRMLEENQALCDHDAPLSPLCEKRHAKIGPLLLSLQVPAPLFHKYFSDFAKEPDPGCTADLTLRLLPRRPLQYTAGGILLRNEEILIADTGGEYLFLPQRGSFVHEMRVTKDGGSAVLYCHCETEREDCLEEIFHMIRFAFLVTAQERGLCVLHSASVLHGGSAWLFSGHSGAGKSTHAKLWHDLFSSPLLNGDLNLLGMQNGQPVCYGLPWCGTSGIRTAAEHPLGGVVFLKQAPRTKVSSLPLDRQILSLSQRMITPCWTRPQVEKNLEIAESLAEKIRIFHLECTKEPEAAETMRRAIEA